jgi:hypothetical protein
METVSWPRGAEPWRGMEVDCRGYANRDQDIGGDSEAKQHENAINRWSQSH